MHFLNKYSHCSGKSLIYQIAIITHVIQSDATALLIFPTKALAQDQKRAFQVLLDACNLNLKLKTYNGDTLFEEKNSCKKASILFTNPDILHTSLLPQHHHWSLFLKKLQIIVIDGNTYT